MFVTGPGHGGPAVVANAYLEGTYTEVYPDITRDEDGMRRLFRQFSFPGGIPSHVAPGDAGLDPRGRGAGLLAGPRLRRGVRQPGPPGVLRGRRRRGRDGAPGRVSWHANKFLNPVPDGAVLPILHLNGYKIANPTVLARIPQDELPSLLEGYGHEVLLSSRETIHPASHRRMAGGWTAWSPGSTRSSGRARERATRNVPRWPMIVLRTPKGWTGPQVVDGMPVEGTFRAHQVPMSAGSRRTPSTAELLSGGCAATGPRSCSTTTGPLLPELAQLAPKGYRRMSANPHSNGGLLLKALALPDFRDYAVDVPTAR